MGLNTHITSFPNNFESLTENENNLFFMTSVQRFVKFLFWWNCFDPGGSGHGWLTL